MNLDDKQLDLLKNYCEYSIDNNQEPHPYDMPRIVSMFSTLAEKGYSVNEEQIDTICDFIHSLVNKNERTHDCLRDFLQNMALVYQYQIKRDGGRFNRSVSKIAQDIINKKHIDYSQT